MWDSENMFSEKQEVAATTPSDNIVNVPDRVGDGKPVYLEVMAGAYTGAGSLAVEVVASDSEDMSDPVTLATYAIPNAALVRGGSLLGAAIPTGAKPFLQLNYVVNGAIAGGHLTAGLVWGVQTNR